MVCRTTKPCCTAKLQCYPLLGPSSTTHIPCSITHASEPRPCPTPPPPEQPLLLPPPPEHLPPPRARAARPSPARRAARPSPARPCCSPPPRLPLLLAAATVAAAARPPRLLPTSTVLGREELGRLPPSSAPALALLHSGGIHRSPPLGRHPSICSRIWTYHGEKAKKRARKEVRQIQPRGEYDTGFDRCLENLANGNVPESPHVEVETPQDAETSEDPEENTKEYYEALFASQKPLHENTEVTQLDAIARLMALKCHRNLCRDGFDELLVIVGSLLPKGHLLPQNFYYSTKLLSDLKMSSQQIHACPKGCMLFREEHADTNYCIKCNSSRYFEVDRNGDGQKRQTTVAKNILRYLPVLPRIHRLFMTEDTAQQMRWAVEGNRYTDKMIHPSDGTAWKNFVKKFPLKAGDPRSVAVAISTDGFNPYGMSAAVYSCWPVFVIPMNLPPGVCMRSENMFVSMIIPGPKYPGKNMNVYLEPLVDDLVRGWEGRGIRTYDASKKEYFDMYVWYHTSLHDLPARALFCGWCTHGKWPCPQCRQAVTFFWLNKGGKYSCFDEARQFLERRHAYRSDVKSFKKGRVVRGPKPIPKTGTEIKAELDALKPSPDGNGFLGYGETHQWTHKPCLWKLPYFEFLELPHNIDVMHTEKNISEAIWSTIVDTEKTKDNIKARIDQEMWCDRPELNMQPPHGAKKTWTKPHAPFCLTKAQKREVFQWMKDSLFFPDGFAANWMRVLNVEVTNFTTKHYDPNIPTKHNPVLRYNAANNEEVPKLSIFVGLGGKSSGSKPYRTDLQERTLIHSYVLNTMVEVKPYIENPTKRLHGWDVVMTVPSRNRPPPPNKDDYRRVDPSAKSVEFYQEEGLPGHFTITLPTIDDMVVDDEQEDAGMDGDNAEDEAEDVCAPEDLSLLEAFRAGIDLDADGPPPGFIDDYWFAEPNDDDETRGAPRDQEEEEVGGEDQEEEVGGEDQEEEGDEEDLSEDEGLGNLVFDPDQSLDWVEPADYQYVPAVERLRPRDRKPYRRGITQLPALKAWRYRHVVLVPYGRSSFKYEDPSQRPPRGYSNILGGLLRWYFPGIVNFPTGGCDVAWRWAHYSLAEDPMGRGTAADLVVAKFWKYFKRAEGKETACDDVLHQLARKRVTGMHYEARIQCVRDWHADRFVHMTKEDARDTLMQPWQYMQNPPQYVGKDDRCFLAMVMWWTCPQYLKKHEEGKKKRAEMRGGSHIQGSIPSLFTCRTRTGAKPNVFAVLKKMKQRKTPDPETGSVWVNPQCETQCTSYVSKFKQKYGEEANPEAEDFDPEVAVLAGEGLKHGRLWFGDGCVDPAKVPSLRQIRRGRKSGQPEVEPRPRASDLAVERLREEMAAKERRPRSKGRTWSEILEYTAAIQMMRRCNAADDAAAGTDELADEPDGSVYSTGEYCSSTLHHAVDAATAHSDPGDRQQHEHHPEHEPR
ncbi:hypothetical protein QYE76_034023 [Lolium multiflorum]|uniref:Uncharacterized protein n=1 Tax=Lolium multiflorum TaxID=4521 RepID=A0AAD8QWC3_LOLMU|nr:hypothetical protein QYE76_034023 [Lolium multiflorum]